MPIVHVARPFIWRSGHNAVLIEKGEQDLTPEQIEHATKHGWLQVQAPVKNKPKTEVTKHGDD